MIERYKSSAKYFGAKNPKAFKLLQQIKPKKRNGHYARDPLGDGDGQIVVGPVGFGASGVTTDFVGMLCGQNTPITILMSSTNVNRVSHNYVVGTSCVLPNSICIEWDDGSNLRAPLDSLLQILDQPTQLIGDGMLRGLYIQARNAVEFHHETPGINTVAVYRAVRYRLPGPIRNFPTSFSGLPRPEGVVRDFVIWRFHHYEDRLPNGEIRTQVVLSTRAREIMRTAINDYLRNSERSNWQDARVSSTRTPERQRTGSSRR
jgi:hypothetical protein